MLPFYPLINLVQDHYCLELDILAKNTSLSLAIITLSVYLIGVLYNQISGYFVKILGYLKIMPRSSSLRKKSFSNSDIDYHEALQSVIAKSSDAYSYLSYRRSMVRIFRSLIFTAFLLFISSFIKYISMDQSHYALNILILLIPFLLFVFSRIVYVKNIKGYYSSITNFYNILTQNE